MSYQGETYWLTPTEKEIFIQANFRLAQSDIATFARRYLSHLTTFPFADFHIEIYSTLQNSETIKRECWVAPRGHAKSTLISIVYPLWHICKGTKKFIVLLSSSSRIAANFFATIKRELESNPFIRRDYGNLVSEAKWTGTEIETKNGVVIAALGAGSNLRGSLKYGARPDLLICDDLEDLENVNTFDQREKLEMWFKKEVLNIGNEKTDIVVIGTILHHDSLLAKLLKEWKGKRYQAINPDGTGTLWQDRFNLGTLKLIRDGDGEKAGIGTLAFEQEYQNNPIDPETQIVKSEWIRYYEPSEIENEELLITSALDPSVGKTTHSDFSAIVTIAKSNGNYYVLDCDMERRSPQAQVGAVANHFQKWYSQGNGRRQYTAFGIESNAFQVVLKNEIDNLGLNIPTVEVKNVSDKVARIQSISPLIEQGRIKFLRSQQRLIDQLITFPKGDHDDGPDALEMAIKLFGQTVNFRWI